jgi:hypothetical protein
MLLGQQVQVTLCDTPVDLCSQAVGNAPGLRTPDKCKVETSLKNTCDGS